MQWIPIQSIPPSIPMDRYPLVAGGPDAVRDLMGKRDRTLTVGVSGWRSGLPFAEGGFPARRGQVNDGENGSLRTPVRRAIIQVIAHHLLAEIAPSSPLWRPP